MSDSNDVLCLQCPRICLSAVLLSDLDRVRRLNIDYAKWRPHAQHPLFLDFPDAMSGNPPSRLPTDRKYAAHQPKKGFYGPSKYRYISREHTYQ